MIVKVIASILLTVLVLVPYFAVFVAVSFLLSLPFRRRLRGLTLLDLLLIALEEKANVRDAVMHLASCDDRRLGRRFFRLGHLLGEGFSLQRALSVSPWSLPRPVAAMLATAEEIGDVRAVLPALKQVHRDAAIASRTLDHYLVLVLALISGSGFIILPLLTVYVLPKYIEIFSDMTGEVPSYLSWISAHSGSFGLGVYILLGIVMVVACAGMIALLPQPRFRSRPERVLAALQWRLPWRRKRGTRDFVNMLGILLDQGVPEERAVRLAAPASANGLFIQRAERAANRIQEGEPLDKALAGLDPGGEFEWRLKNAVAGTGGFMRALEGWSENLNAEAMFQEQMVTQISGSALVIFAGLVSGVICAGIFGALTNLTIEAALW